MHRCPGEESPAHEVWQQDISGRLTAGRWERYAFQSLCTSVLAWPDLKALHFTSCSNKAQSFWAFQSLLKPGWCCHRRSTKLRAALRGAQLPLPCSMPTLAAVTARCFLRQAAEPCCSRAAGLKPCLGDLHHILLSPYIISQGLLRLPFRDRQEGLTPFLSSVPWMLSSLLLSVQQLCLLLPVCHLFYSPYDGWGSLLLACKADRTLVLDFLSWGPI